MSHPATDHFEQKIREAIHAGISNMKERGVTAGEGRETLLRTLTTLINEIDVGMIGFRSDAIVRLQIAESGAQA